MCVLQSNYAFKCFIKFMRFFLLSFSTSKAHFLTWDRKRERERVEFIENSLLHLRIIYILYLLSSSGCLIVRGTRDGSEYVNQDTFFPFRSPKHLSNWEIVQKVRKELQEWGDRE